MSVKITYREQESEVKAGMTLRDAIRRCGLSPEAVLALRAGALITDDVKLQEGDESKLVAVVSGG